MKSKGLSLLSTFANKSAGEKQNSRLTKLFGEVEPVEDGRISLKPISKYRSLKDIYRSFGEKISSDEAKAKEDFESRVDSFRIFIENYEEGYE